MYILKSGNRFQFLLIILINLDIFQSISIIDTVICMFSECCQEPYLLKNYNRLEVLLHNELHGQPLVKEILLTSIKGHLGLKNPSKALVLSFHGSAGVGKTLVSQILAESLYLKGTKSNFFKFYSATRDFDVNQKINEYKERLKKEIEQTVKQCEYSFFVFDELDKIPIGLLDTIKTYIDFNHEIGGVDFRKSIFIFLSNIASKKINELFLENDSKNMARENFKLKTFEELIIKDAFLSKGEDERGMFHASIIDNWLIDYYVPFLPLERKHVKKCILKELKNYNFNDKTYFKTRANQDIDEIADEMTYEPSGIPKFSISGCKRIPNIVRNFIKQKKYLINDEL